MLLRFSDQGATAAGNAATSAASAAVAIDSDDFLLFAFEQTAWRFRNRRVVVVSEGRVNILGVVFFFQSIQVEQIKTSASPDKYTAKR